MSLLQELFTNPWIALISIVAILLALSFHEASHAFAAYLLGDNTAKREGRLTLNPAAHVDLWGLIAVIVVGIGWGKPVPFNPYNLKYPRLGPVLVAGAGPVSNILLGTVAALIFRFVGPFLNPNNMLGLTIGTFLVSIASISFLLALFNLIPIPPLDGSKALLAILSAPQYRNARFILETQGPLILIGLIVVDSFLNIGLFNALAVGAQAMFSFVLHL